MIAPLVCLDCKARTPRGIEDRGGLHHEGWICADCYEARLWEGG